MIFFCCTLDASEMEVEGWRKKMIKTEGIYAEGYIAELKGGATRVIVDPPFLSEDCQTKGRLTLSKYVAIADR